MYLQIDRCWICHKSHHYKQKCSGRIVFLSHRHFNLYESLGSFTMHIFSGLVLLIVINQLEMIMVVEYVINIHIDWEKDKSLLFAELHLSANYSRAWSYQFDNIFLIIFDMNRHNKKGRKFIFIFIFFTKIE